MPSIGHKLLSGATLRVVNLVTNLLVAFLLSPFIIHTLGDRLYGFWSLVGTFIGYYGLLDFGFSTAVSRHIAGALGAGDEKKIKRVYNTAIPIFSGIGSIALFVTIVIAFLSPLFFDDPEEISLFRAVILILGLNVALSFLARVFIGTLRAQMNFHIISYVQILMLILRTFLIVFALNAGYKLLALAWISFFTTSASNLLYCYFARKKLPALRLETKSFDFGTATTLFSYSFFMMISQMANQLRFHADAFVIATFLSLSAVTHYSIASTLTQYFLQLVSTVVSVFTPLFSQLDAKKSNHDEIKKTLYFATRISVAISTFIGFGMVAWGSPFVERWMGIDYLDAYPCLIVLVLGVLCFVWQLPAHSFLYATSKHRTLALINLIEGGGNICLSLVLVRYYDILGVALGTFFAFFISKLVVFPIYLARVSFFNYVQYISNLFLYIVKCCISLILPLMITFFLISADYVHLFLVGAFGILLYCFHLVYLVG